MEYKTYTTTEILQFTEKYLGQAKQKGKELIVKICPYCGKTDKLSINTETGIFQCWSCQTTGGIGKLNKDYGEKPMRETITEPAVSHPKKPEIPFLEKVKQIKFKALDENMIQYFHKRGITKQSLESCKVKQLGDRIVFGYTFNGVLTAIKYRTVEKVITAESGSKTSLWQIDNIDTNKTWVICEGEIDHLSFLECGINNVTTVSNGALALGWIDTYFDKIKAAKEIILAFDFDEKGIKAISEITKRLDINKIKIMEYQGEKDCNDLLMKKGKDAVLTELSKAKKFNIEGLFNAGLISEEYKPERIKSGFTCLNKSIGGFVLSGLTVLTGTPGSGKSTLAGQIILDAININEKVFIYSGELRKEVYLQWLMLQACRVNDTLGTRCEVRDKLEHTPKKENVKDIKTWFMDKIYLFEKEKSATENELMESILFSYQRHGTKLFIIDNLMKIKFTGKESNKFESQILFVDKLKSFANNYNVHIILIAHPRKPESGNKIHTIYDISGASEIVNLADNVLGIHRLTQKELVAKSELADKNISTSITVYKNREFGDATSNMYLKFEWRNKRFIEPDEYEKKYKWEIVEEDINQFDF